MWVPSGCFPNAPGYPGASVKISVSPVRALPVKTLILDLVGGDLGAPLGFACVAEPVFLLS